MDQNPSDKKKDKKTERKRQRSKSQEAVKFGGAVGGQPAEETAKPGPSSSRRRHSDVKASPATSGKKTSQSPDRAASPPKSPEPTEESPVPISPEKKPKKSKIATPSRTVLKMAKTAATGMGNKLKTGYETIASKLHSHPKQDKAVLVTEQDEPAADTETTEGHQSPPDVKEPMFRIIDLKKEGVEVESGNEPPDTSTEPETATTRDQIHFTPHWSVFGREGGQSQSQKVGTDMKRDETLQDVPDLPMDTREEFNQPTQEDEPEEKMDVSTEDKVEKEDDEN